jgi:Cu-processing system permease protein
LTLGSDLPVSAPLLWLCLALWMAIPLWLAYRLFNRRCP